MITLNKSTAEAIRIEMESIPEKYQKPFNSVHEGLAVLREEYVELENEIFFGEKRAKEDYPKPDYPLDREVEHEKQFVHDGHKNIWRARIKQEAIQVAAMAARIIQELT